MSKPSVAAQAQDSSGSEVRKINGHAQTKMEHAFTYYARLTRVRSHVLTRITSDLSLTEIAGVAGMSPKYFSAFFRQHTGICFRDWVAEKRIEHATALIAERNYSITRVAFSCGFRDLRTFQRSFKRLTGTTPREYKKSVGP